MCGRKLAGKRTKHLGSPKTRRVKKPGINEVYGHQKGALSHQHEGKDMNTGVQYTVVIGIQEL
jgi:hypothetical protein